MKGIQIDTADALDAFLCEDSVSLLDMHCEIALFYSKAVLTMPA